MNDVPRITFFLASAEEARGLDDLDPDRDWMHFSHGTAIWISQTYLRLKHTGLPVQLSTAPTRDGIVVLHADDLHSYFNRGGSRTNNLIVCVRADRSAQLYADIEVVQNRSSADASRCHFIPHWPQPGLVPRDDSRGASIASIAFKGHQTECHPMFATAQWSSFAQSNALRWSADTATWADGMIADRDRIHWNDYRSVDLIVAIRSDATNPYMNKPASKLINAWLAGVPAILGPEVAYREMRRSELDYIEASSLVEVLDAVSRLRAAPGLYRAMIENGRARAKEFHPDAITAHWRAFLIDRLLPQQSTLLGWILRRAPVGLKYRFRQAMTKMAARPPSNTAPQVS